MELEANPGALSDPRWGDLSPVCFIAKSSNQKYNSEMMKLLLKNGLDLTFRDNDGLSLMQELVNIVSPNDKNTFDLFKILLIVGVPVQDHDNMGESIIQDSVKRNDIMLVIFFFAKRC